MSVDEGGAVIHNPYWEMVKSRAAPSTWPGSPPGALEIGGFGGRGVDQWLKDDDHYSSWQLRETVTHRYAWTVTDPPTVDFVAQHCGPCVIDPIAGTGYWAMLLMQYGKNVKSYDIDPPRKGSQSNFWHPDTEVFFNVWQADAVEAIGYGPPDATLLLSWPPYDDPTAAWALRAYQGDRVIFIGEGEGGCTADDDFFQLLEKDWQVKNIHQPVQFYGIHDYVFVFDRRDRNQLPGSS
jgi:hypothetical protein